MLDGDYAGLVEGVVVGLVVVVVLGVGGVKAVDLEVYIWPWGRVDDFDGVEVVEG